MKNMHVTIEFDYEVEDDVSAELVEDIYTQIAEKWNVHMIGVDVIEQPF